MQAVNEIRSDQVCFARKCDGCGENYWEPLDMVNLGEFTNRYEAHVNSHKMNSLEAVEKFLQSNKAYSFELGYKQNTETWYSVFDHRFIASRSQFQYADTAAEAIQKAFDGRVK